MNPHDAVQTLINAANDIGLGVEIRKGAILGLGHAGGFNARGALSRILASMHNGPELRAAAGTALGLAAQRE